MPENPVSSYDEIAGVYHALWADWYLPAATTALENLFFSRIPRGARVLDLCCGSGHVTKELVRRAYDVTGVDSSAELVALARQGLPEVDLRVQDARHLQLEKRYHAVLSTFDSLNHMMILDDLRDVFLAVRGALKRGGLFVFDMNLEEAYSADLRQWTVNVNDNAVGLVRGTYDPITRKAATELIWFVRTTADNLWTQHRSVVEERCYSQSEILVALTESGFKNVEAIAAKNAGMRADVGFGRVFFVAKR